MNKLKFHLNGRLLTWQVFERDWADYLTFVVMSPILRHGDIGYSSTQTDTRGFSLELPTNISWKKSDYSWSLVIRFMGFGVQIFRQWGY